MGLHRVSQQKTRPIAKEQGLRKTLTKSRPSKAGKNQTLSRRVDNYVGDNVNAQITHNKRLRRGLIQLRTFVE